MADKQMKCPTCAEVKPHLTITEARIHICSNCGTETKFKPGETGPAPREPKRAPYAPEAVRGETIARKTETEGKPMAKLTAEQKSDIIRRREAGEGAKALATEFGVSEQAVYYVTAGKKVKKAKAQAKARPAARTEAGVGFKQQVERMVAEAVDKRLAGLGLDCLDAKIEDALARLLK